MRANPDFTLRQIGDVCLIVRLNDTIFQKDNVITTNESGAILWDTLKKNCTRKELLSSLQAEYEVDEETALSDIDAFLASLKSAGALSD